ncbi:hypothetical protein ACHAXA_007935 [Cyclostephanos tholiformis]|uniref:Polynucleotide adenylyltransferase n=1 Tax=Cyclostephanos tholiformis TaxID=382380 RepID=A0ABD3R194_9STRA
MTPVPRPLPRYDDDDQSVSMESMGRSDDDDDNEEDDEGEEDESMIPMKRPARRRRDDDDESVTDGGEGGDAEQSSSFLDDDFLSFSNVDNGAVPPSQRKNVAGKDNGRRRDDNPRCHPVNVDGGGRPKIVPWLSYESNTLQIRDSHYHRQRQQQQQQQQQQQWGRGGYSVNNGHNSNSSVWGYGGIDDNYNHRHRHARMTPPLIRLHNEIVSFVDLMSPTIEEMKLREGVVKRVTGLAVSTFGEGARVLPFGSQVTGLCLPGSDVDFVIRLPTRKEGDGTDDVVAATDGDNPLRRFADVVLNEYGTRSQFLDGDDDDDIGGGGGDVLRVAIADRDDENDDENDDSNYDANVDDYGGKVREYLSYLEVIEQTRVPLVKFTISPHNIDVDVCFDQPHGPESAELMHRFMESMPPLRPLTFVLKYFLASRDINKPFTGGIGSYLLQLMIVSYLQHRAREDVSRRQDGGGMRHYNLGSLLLDFLELYGVDFNYVTTGISVRHDGYYFPKGSHGRRDSFWQPSRPFSIAMENPLDPTSDVGAGAFRMQMIQRVFGHAFKTLLAYVSEPAEPTDSILARIIPPTEEMEQRMIAKRRMSEWEEEADDGGDDDEEEEEEDNFRSSVRGGNVVNGRKRRKMAGRKQDEKRRKYDRIDNDDGKDDRSRQKRRHSTGGGDDEGKNGDWGKKRGIKRGRIST